MAHVVLSSGCLCLEAPSWAHLVLAPECGDECAVPLPPDPAAPSGLTGQVRQRTRTGFDEDGTPEFEWETVSDGPVTVEATRDEFDAEAGQTFVSGVMTATVPVPVTETAMVVLSDGTRWRVFGVEQAGELTRLKVVRIGQADTGEVNS
jgi:hypothetical protein